MRIKENVKEQYINMDKYDKMNICRRCPIFSNDLCNSHLYLNPETNDVSDTPKDGYIKGCGCYVPSKVSLPNKHCPAKKW